MEGLLTALVQTLRWGRLLPGGAPQPALQEGTPEAGTWLTFLHTDHIIPEWVPIALPWAGIVIVLLVLLSFIGTRRLSRIPSGLQGLLELAVGGIESLTLEITGPEGRRFVPFIGSLFIYIAVMNLFGLVPGFASPTANLNTTVGLALTVFLVVQFYGFRLRGLSYVRHFTGDIWPLAPLMLPIHIVGELARPLSLALRLYGNVSGEDIVILSLIAVGAKLLVPYIPYQLPMILLAAFTSIVQAMIFAVLAAVYLADTLPEAEH